MAKAKNGDKVRVHYTGTLDDGSVFDSSEGFVDKCNDGGCGCKTHAADPLEFVIGEGNLIPKFEETVIGLEPGQRAQVKISAEDSYGVRTEEMVAVIERSELPEEMAPVVGQQMEVVLQDGSPMPVVVIEVTDKTITLDANHPLAGMNLNFDIKLLEIL